MATHALKPLVLVVLDGWGIAPPGPHNAIALAKTPTMDMLWKERPHATLKAAGNAVGLSEGFMGNSEIGHLHLGAGQIVWQPMELINRKIKSGEFFDNPALKGAFENARKHNTHVHLMGLCSDAGVHAMLSHLYALLETAKKEGFSKVYVHPFLDGRDVGEKTAPHYLKQLQDKIKEIGIGKIATLCGRYYAMDRDKNWERTEKAYRLLVQGEGTEASDAVEAVKTAYANGAQTDYYVPPILLDKEGIVRENDSVVFYNYRSDRTRQLSAAFVLPNFEHFNVTHAPLYFAGMSRFDVTLPMEVAFPQSVVKGGLAQALSDAGKTQIHIAETEKYAHVTFFFNAQVEEPVKGEERVLVPSLKVPSYDQAPEMSAEGITQEARKAIKSKKFDFMLVNFANGDLVGHSGKLKAVIKGVEKVDACLKRVAEAVKEAGGAAMVTADHGNAEQMAFEDGSPCPAHTTNPVPFILIHPENPGLRPEGGLIDVAPTILELMGLSPTPQMEGKSLLKA